MAQYEVRSIRSDVREEEISTKKKLQKGSSASQVRSMFAGLMEYPPYTEDRILRACDISVRGPLEAWTAWPAMPILNEPPELSSRFRIAEHPFHNLFFHIAYLIDGKWRPSFW